MTIRICTRWIWIIALLGLALAWGCNTGGNALVDSSEPTLGLTISTPEATLAAIEGITIAETALTSEHANATEAQTPSISTPTLGPVEIMPMEPWVARVDEELVNIRVGPSTATAIVGSISPGEQKTVIGQVIGEVVDPNVIIEDGEGNIIGEGNLWYALEEGGFVFSGLLLDVGDLGQ